ncbi:bifunctional folylpolyglutamate synthase/dihydrofolate synthase [Marinibactrum halimedae]|uniref:Dihydrofolate synthase/folylpolyglutamate synthase n=1 Tax=Marinibactrum halimedae TaxID=1444977 RepID=A0AA37TA57_9GAMM|nr:folylpolyglutamate synthase/dihydrofolate synthase family protein [Marinibactrum halimedae]MCD9460760.1 bifunctional folylpolyglutamate synthase/dihydrofolate synthase [Marinibactrum halimedae]GLS26666.1 bifunctional folylpolyglutamate synthase/dihydrofolate synthase [Marinibactrum halimedae]
MATHSHSPRFQTLEQWLSWQETLHKTEIDLGLTRVQRVAERLGLTNASIIASYESVVGSGGEKHKPPAIITVAGTNGKGSCVAALQAMLLDQGLKTGAYTSPHLVRYNERIRLNGEEASDEDICEAFAAIDEARGDTTVTYFEFGTLAAFYLFKKYQVDAWLMEVGLGGRLDAVNVVDPTVSVITSIDLDHMEWLGDNREDIGREKAGIFRANTPAICADLDPPQSIAETASQVEALRLQWGEAFGARLDTDNNQWCWWANHLNESCTEIQLPIPHLPHQSVAAALMALLCLDWLPSPERLVHIVGNLSLAGRQQHLTMTLTGRQDAERPSTAPVLLDVAHNPAAGRALADKLSSLRHANPDREIWVLVAMMGNKDLPGTLGPLLPWVDHWICPSIDTPRALPGAEMADCLLTLGVNSSRTNVVATVSEGLSLFEGAQVERKQLIVMGSFYTVGEAMEDPRIR